MKSAKEAKVTIYIYHIKSTAKKKKYSMVYYYKNKLKKPYLHTYLLLEFLFIF